MPAVIGRTNLKSTSTQGSEPSTVTMTFSQVHLNELMANTVISLQKDVEIKTTEIAGLNSTITGLQQTITTKTAELAQANQSLTALQAQKDIVDAELIAAQNSILQLTSDLDTAEASLTQAQSDLSTANAALAQSQSDLAAAQGQVTSLTSDLQTANANLSTANGDLVVASLTIASQQETITDLQAQLQNSPGPSGDVTVSPLNQDISTWTYFDEQLAITGVPWATAVYDAAGDKTTFTTQALASAQAYPNTNGSIIPRWSTPMFYSDGTPVLDTDSFILQWEIPADTINIQTPTASAANWCLMIGMFGNIEATTSSRGPIGGGFLCQSQGRVTSYAYHLTTSQGSLLAYTSDLQSLKGMMMTNGMNRLPMYSVASLHQIWGSSNQYNRTDGAVGAVGSILSSNTAYTFNGRPPGSQVDLVIWLQSRSGAAATTDAAITAGFKWCVEKW
jgi:exonuclease VII small subunit